MLLSGSRRARPVADGRAADRARRPRARRPGGPGQRQARRGPRRGAARSRRARRRSATAAVTLDEPQTVEVDRLRARFGAWYELFPRSWGGLRGVRAPAAAAGRARVRRRLPAADPPDRPHQPQGSRQRPDRAGPTTRAHRGRSATPPAATTPSTRSWAPIDDLRSLTAAAAGHGIDIALDFAIQCFGRPPVADRAPGVVSPPARRHPEVRREPAQALPGHLQRQLGARRTGARCGTRCWR